MGLQAITWFDIERHTHLLNSLLLFFDEIYVPNTLWLETGSKFEDVFLKLSHTRNEIYDVVLTPVFLGGDPESSAVPFCKVYGELPIERKHERGIFVPFCEVLYTIDEYPTIFRDIVHDIFNKVNEASPFQEYNKFTYEYAKFIRNGLNFIGKRETRGDGTTHWFDNFRNYIERCFDVENNLPIVFDAKTILDIEKYHSHSAISLRYNSNILVSALLLSLAKVHIKDFVTTDPRVILDLRETLKEDKAALVNSILQHSMTLHKLLDEEASFADLLNEAEFVVKAEILPAFENAKVRYEHEMGKSSVKKLITFTDKIINFGFSAFTLNYSGARESLKDMHNICTGKALQKTLLESGESYSNYCYLLRLEQEAN